MNLLIVDDEASLREESHTAEPERTIDRHRCVWLQRQMRADHAIRVDADQKFEHTLPAGLIRRDGDRSAGGKPRGSRPRGSTGGFWGTAL